MVLNVSSRKQPKYFPRTLKDLSFMCCGRNGYRSAKHSSRGVCKKGILKNFAKFTGKHLCQILPFNKVTGRPVNFAKFSRTSFLIEKLRWLLLEVSWFQENSPSLKNSWLHVCYDCNIRFKLSHIKLMGWC